MRFPTSIFGKNRWPVFCPKLYQFADQFDLSAYFPSTFTFQTGCSSAWLERYVRDVEAASSNLVTPIFLA